LTEHLKLVTDTEVQWKRRREVVARHWQLVSKSRELLNPESRNTSNKVASLPWLN
jgi:hypothetical protein